jgi:sterol desaturase/sphingolipid hydroxylase (fatty acid hydroxylase superfamily)
MEFPELNQDNFGLIKFGGFAVCFLAAAVLQLIFPYHRINKLVFQNWRINLPLSLLNTAFFSLFCVSCACAWSVKMQAMQMGLFNVVALPALVTMSLSLLLLDFTAYVWHRLNHKLSFFWLFHSVHHSDRVFEASTALRFHFGELLFSLGIRLVMISLFGLSVGAILLFELVFQFFNIIIHANVRLSPVFENLVAKVFMTPAHHRKHHSLLSSEMNSNFGTIFSIWDRIGWSFRPSQSSEKIQVGVSHLEARTLLQVFLLPFREFKSASLR